MNLGEAIGLLKEGERVARRPNPERFPDEAMRWAGARIVFVPAGDRYTPSIDWVSADGARRDWGQPTHEDRVAHDWEVVD